jgi:rhodanese-related sulfurtransferase
MIHLSTTKELAIIFFLTLSISLIVNYFHPKGLQLTVPYSPETIQNQTVAESLSGPQSIDIKEAASCYGKKDYLFVDARSEADYDICHIKNAINLPEHNFDKYLDAFMTKTHPQQKLITYCGAADCPLGSHLAEKLFFMGFENVFHLVGGMDAWQNENLPVEQQ